MAAVADEAEGPVVFPGDRIQITADGRTRLRQGLLALGAPGEAVASKAGRLVEEPARVFWVDNKQKRYMPEVDDLVLGTIVEKHTENYRLDIGTAVPARLPALAFEGATKRNKPSLQIGDLVYARVVLADKHMETELACTSPHFKKDWVTGESIFGQLKGGYAFKVPIHHARQVLREDCPVLMALGQHFPFELAIGANGMIWVRAQQPTQTVVISNAIVNAEGLTTKQQQQMVRQLVRSIQEDRD